MKKDQLSLGEKVIETPSLLIKKNIMVWDNTMIQLSNISYVSAANVAATTFPIWAALLVLLSFFMFGKSTLLALVLLAVGGIWIYSWYQENEKRKQEAILTIRMNSGHSLCFAFEKKAFLYDVLTVLERIIIDGGEHQVDINVENCTFSGDAEILNGISV